MLTNDVKRNIDNARNVLVGRIPNPQSQIDQITTAMIYKFMYDMDIESRELGGKASFLTGVLKRYSWDRYFDDRLSADEKFNLYDDALRTFATAKQLPQLFQQIFKDAFLPYRDSRVLRLFLKEINKFQYDHSEALGNGFEYLLSILGSQGDAGQFRTPRNIIDFMVEVIDPKKNEMILDPACGTAGFLISSFKHIKKHNSTNFKPKTDLPTFMRKGKKDVHEIEIQENGKYKGDKLTAPQKKKLHQNIHGYDISPDMVRLSRVNMYLHHIKKQNIFVYDTLSSTAKWEDDFDIILANPPFMTPRGGIVPHNKFGVQAKRSEVLFVDYIAEHIKTTGRGACIVPEGIIFQIANAYKQLRKNLIDGNVLYAVVSLPAGIFQPYSGVKTSILFFNRQIAKAKDEILFIKVENDGFDLGSQRRAIDKNDLGEAYYILREYEKKQISKTSEIYKHIDTSKIDKISHAVKKEKIAEDGDYNLTGDRYRETVDYSNIKWPMVKLGEVCEILDSLRQPVKKADRRLGEYPYYGATGIVDYVDKYLFEEKLVLVGEDGAKWSSGEKTAFVATGKYWVNNHAHVLRPIRTKLLDELLIELLNDLDLNSYITGITVPKLNQQKLKQIKIPLPPLEVQKEIVVELDSYQKVIDGARQVAESYKPHIKINPDWTMVKLGEVCEFNPKKAEAKELSKDTIVSFVPMADLNENEMFFDIKQEKEIGKVYSGYTYFAENDVLLARVTPCFENGKSGIARNLINKIGFGSSEYFIYRAIRKKALPEWIYYFISSNHFVETGKGHMSGTGGLQRLTKDYASNYQIPLPPLKVQREIVAEIEKEQAMVNECKKLIEIHEQKIKTKIAEVWGEE